MRTAARYDADSRSPRLRRRAREDRLELWTEAAGLPPAVYGERWASVDGRALRSFEPARSKLAAGLQRGWDGPLPSAGTRWLYLGAASGTTASHVADLLGPDGALYAVERSLRPFTRLVAVAERWPNLLPLLADARVPETYADRVPIVDGIYADVAQPDQVAIVLANAELFLRDRGGAVLLALKTSSMGRGLNAPAHLREAEAALAPVLRLDRSVRLDPFHRSHYLVGGRQGAAPPELTRRGRGSAIAGPPRPRGKGFRRRRGYAGGGSDRAERTGPR